MNLEDITQELDNVSKRLVELLPQLRIVEYAYNRVYFDSIMRSGMGNAEKREAEAMLTCEQEGVLVPFEEVKIEVRTLLHRKEALIEMGKNIRTLRGEDL